MKYRTIFNADARAQIRAIDVTAARRILRKLTDLEQDPYGLKTTELVGPPGIRRLRVGDYRILYTIDNGQVVITVVAVGHRSTAYNE